MAFKSLVAKTAEYNHIIKTIPYLQADFNINNKK